jgi:long-chain acyl-CoA synthetase
VNKPWLQRYPAGVPAEIDLSAYASILDIFDQSCAKYRDRTAYINFDRALSYGDLDRLSRDFAAWLQSKGMRRVTAWR